MMREVYFYMIVATSQFASAIYYALHGDVFWVAITGVLTVLMGAVAYNEYNKTDASSGGSV